jgi:hypothetical protein
METHDPWRAATTLIEMHGGGARGEALRRIIAMRQSGDLSGLVLWKAVLEGVLDVERFDPSDDRVLH